MGITLRPYVGVIFGLYLLNNKLISLSPPKFHTIIFEIIVGESPLQDKKHPFLKPHFGTYYVQW